VNLISRCQLLILCLAFSACSAQSQDPNSMDNSKYNFDYSALTESIQVYEKGCGAEDDISCAKLGMAYLNRREDELAMPLLDNACQDGFGLVCHSIGMKYRISALGKPRGERSEDFSLATKYFRSACNASHSDSEGCRMLAGAYEEASGVLQDNLLALEFYKKACDNKNGRACDRLGTAYEKGQLVSRDQERAVDYYTIACELKQNSSCKSLHLNHVRRCDAGQVKDCITVSNMYEDGIGLGYDYKEWHRLGNAADYYSRACSLGDRSACKKSESTYRRACTLGNEKACTTNR